MAYINGKEILFSPTIIADDIKYNEGYNEGYNKGYAEGYENGKAEGGGADNLIGFIYDQHGTPTILFAEEGMTWGEWCESEYNTIDAFVNGSSIYIGINWLSVEGGDTVSDSDVITANTTYGFYYN